VIFFSFHRLARLALIVLKSAIKPSTSPRCNARKIGAVPG
jgi:hypothetical protein